MFLFSRHSDREKKGRDGRLLVHSPNGCHAELSPFEAGSLGLLLDLPHWFRDLNTWTIPTAFLGTLAGSGNGTRVARTQTRDPMGCQCHCLLRVALAALSQGQLPASCSICCVWLFACFIKLMELLQKWKLGHIFLPYEYIILVAIGNYILS